MVRFSPVCGGIEEEEEHLLYVYNQAECAILPTGRDQESAGGSEQDRISVRTSCCNEGMH